MKRLKILLLLVLCVSLTACCEESEYENGYDDGYRDAKAELSEYGYEMYQKGYDEAYTKFVDEIIYHEAVRYARGFSDWHPEEAMGIIECYERGDHYYGGTPITEEDYLQAVKSLYYYYAYFYNALYEEDIECSYDFYEKQGG